MTIPVGSAITLVGVNFRPAPGTDNTPIEVLPAGIKVDVLDSATPGWHHVIHGGQTGFISADPRYTKFTKRHTDASDLVTVTTAYPTSRPILLHARAAAAFMRVQVYPGLTSADVQALCRINSSFRHWDRQMEMIRSYESAIGEPWKPWKDLTPSQRASAAATSFRFAYHPGFPVDAPHTHVGGGALDISRGLSAKAIEALEANGFRRDTKGDDVHWAWHG